MRNITWAVLIWGLPIAVIGGLIGDLSYERGYKVGSATQAALVEQSKPVYNTDQVCAQWLFEANMKDVRKRMCGGK